MKKKSYWVLLLLVIYVISISLIACNNTGGPTGPSGNDSGNNPSSTTAPTTKAETINFKSSAINTIKEKQITKSNIHVYL